MINPPPLPKKIIKNKDVTLLNEVSIIITVEMIGENKVVMRLLIKSSSDSHGVSGKKARRTPHKDVVIAPIFTETRIERWNKNRIDFFSIEYIFLGGGGIGLLATFYIG